jgi:hypothetical protein
MLKSQKSLCPFGGLISHALFLLVAFTLGNDGLCAGFGTRWGQAGLQSWVGCLVTPARPKVAPHQLPTICQSLMESSSTHFRTVLPEDLRQTQTRHLFDQIEAVWKGKNTASNQQKPWRNFQTLWKLFCEKTVTQSGGENPAVRRSPRVRQRINSGSRAWTVRVRLHSKSQRGSQSPQAEIIRDLRNMGVIWVVEGDKKKNEQMRKSVGKKTAFWGFHSENRKVQKSPECDKISQNGFFLLKSLLPYGLESHFMDFWTTVLTWKKRSWPYVATFFHDHGSVTINCNTSDSHPHPIKKREKFPCWLFALTA